ncbi:MAG: hypothetical protein AcusKO_15410 [Acuticoccus sp.]
MNTSESIIETMRSRLDAHLERGEIDAAADVADAVTRRWPESSQAWLCAAKTASLRPPLLGTATLRNAWRRFPDHPVIRWRYASALNSLQNVALSQELLETLLETRGDDLGVMRVAARNAILVDDWTTARQLWERIAESSSNEDACIHALRVLANCWATLDNPAKAAAIYRRLMHQTGSTEDRQNYLQVLARSTNRPFVFVDGASSNGRTFGQAPDNPTPLQNALERDPADRDTRTRLVRLLLGRGESAAALRHAEIAVDAAPDDIAVIRLHAAALAANDRRREAHDVLDSALARETAFPLLAEKSLVFELEGDTRMAIQCATKAARLCPNIANLQTLTRLLRRDGRFSAAASLVATIERRFGTVIPGRNALATLASQLGDARGVIHWADNRVGDPPAQLGMILSDALWQVGESERAWHCALAHATAESAFLSKNPAIRREASADLKREVAAHRSAGDAAATTAERTRHMARLSELLLRKSTMKSYRRPNQSLGAALRDFTAHVENGRLDVATAAFDAIYERSVRAVGSPSKIGHLLRRMADVDEACRRPGARARRLELACRIDRHDFVARALYRRELQRAGGLVPVGGDPQVAIMILTWRGNLHEAEAIAETLSNGGARTVFCLWGDEDRETMALTPTVYGHQLVVPCDDGYEALPRKVLLGLRAIEACTNAVGVLKIDDDIALLDQERFQAMLHHCAASQSGYVGSRVHGPSPIYHSGRSASDETANVFTISAQYSPEYAGGGEGYYLSRRCLQHVGEHSLTDIPADAPGVLYEDAYIGDLLAAAGVRLENATLPDLGGYVTDCFEPERLLDCLG